MIDPLFFSQECSDARMCVRTGPVCMCGIEKMREELMLLREVAGAVTEEEAALDACDRHEPGALKRHAEAFVRVKGALAALHGKFPPSEKGAKGC